jgi:hypothetical protein
VNGELTALAALLIASSRRLGHPIVLSHRVLKENERARVPLTGRLSDLA